MPEKILVALGGNALVKAGQRGTVAEQAGNVRRALAGVIELIRQGHRVVITHGNGPQVGHILVRAEEARGKAYDLPLDVCVAQSQGETGYLIQQGLEGLLHRNGIDRPVAVLVTRTVVSRDDPRMKTPSKPVGPFYTKDQGVRLSEQGFHLVEDAHRGYRRVVPSPVPLRIVEADIIRRFFEEGVVDKDLASSVLGAALGADVILDLTAVDGVKLDFGSPQERSLKTLTVAEAKKYLAEGHFAPGSMGPKIEAAIGFLEQGGREVIITLPERVLEAREGRAGTVIRAETSIKGKGARS